MNKNKIVASVKRQEEEKVGFSLKLPVSLKEQFQTLAEKESISMNALIVATLQSLIDDDCGKQLTIAKNIIGDYQKKIDADLEYYNYNNITCEEEYNSYQQTLLLKSQIDNFLKE